MGDGWPSAGGLAIPQRVKVYFDGGCRTAAGIMETAVVVRGRTWVERDLGPGTSMDAEWLALIRAVEVAGELGLTDALFLGDALGVILPATGALKCRAAFAHHLERLKRVSGEAGALKIRHIKRTQNLAGIALARGHGR